MLPKAHLTLHSRMSGSRWMTTSSWLSGSWRSFLYSFSVYSCYLFLISFASVRNLSFLSFILHDKLWKILKEMRIPDHLTCLLRNLYSGQEATVWMGHGTTDWFQIWKGVHQHCILSPCLFNLYAEYIMKNTNVFVSIHSFIPGWKKHKLESRLPGEISITSDTQMLLLLLLLSCFSCVRLCTTP